jgi:hypothetical protein
VATVCSAAYSGASLSKTFTGVKYQHDFVPAAHKSKEEFEIICDYLTEFFQRRICMLMGQWSEPRTSGKMWALSNRCKRDFEMQK